jgi:hypothetical protein
LQYDTAQISPGASGWMSCWGTGSGSTQPVYNSFGKNVAPTRKEGVIQVIPNSSNEVGVIVYQNMNSTTTDTFEIKDSSDTNIYGKFDYQGNGTFPNLTLTSSETVNGVLTVNGFGTFNSDINLYGGNSSDISIFNDGAGQSASILDRGSGSSSILNFETNSGVFIGPSGTQTGSFLMAVSTSVTNATQGGPYFIDISSTGHLNSQFPSVQVSTISSCGGGNAVLSGSDIAGTILMGSSSTSACSLVFAKSYKTAPVCTFTTDSGNNPSSISVIDTSHVTFSFTSSVSGTHHIWYICIGSD